MTTVKPQFTSTFMPWMPTTGTPFHLQVLSELLEHGADVKARDENRFNLPRCMSRNGVEVVVLLMRAARTCCESMSREDDDPKTAFHDS
jgi:hypothetical protein